MTTFAMYCGCSFWTNFTGLWVMANDLFSLEVRSFLFKDQL